MVSKAGRPPGYLPHAQETEAGVLALVGHWSEDELDRHLRALALALNWWPYHTRLSLRSEGGFPDWILLKPPRLLLVECKRQGLWPTPPRLSKRGRWSIGQAQWLLRWSRQPHVEVYLAWPSDHADLARILQEGPDPAMPCVRRTAAVLEAAARGGNDAQEPADEALRDDVGAPGPGAAQTGAASRAAGSAA
jgi:hypothetical protein